MSCMLLEIDCFLMFWCPFCAQECKEPGFDAIELNTDFIHLPEEDLLRLTHSIKGAGLKARPELGIESANDVMILSTWLMVKCHWHASLTFIVMDWWNKLEYFHSFTFLGIFWDINLLSGSRWWCSCHCRIPHCRNFDGVDPNFMKTCWLWDSNTRPPQSCDMHVCGYIDSYNVKRMWFIVYWGTKDRLDAMDPELEGANWVVRRAERFLGAGADVVWLIQMESQRMWITGLLSDWVWRKLYLRQQILGCLDGSLRTMVPRQVSCCTSVTVSSLCRSKQTVMF